jgi:hypothetical protein
MGQIPDERSFKDYRWPQIAADFFSGRSSAGLETYTPFKFA